MTQLLVLNPEKATAEEIKGYLLREAVRAVVIDDEGRIALLHVTKSNYFKLPGGGVEKGEDLISALNRECLEEIGSKIEIVDEIGRVTEYRKMFGLTQISYCYFAKQKGKKGKLSLTSEETDDGFEQLWLPYNVALLRISNNVATSKEGREYIVPRDTTFLKEAEKYLHRIKKL